MPRADRDKKAATKALAEAAAQPGQSRITSIIARTSGTNDANELAVCAVTEGDTSENETQMPVDDNVAIQETWVNSANDYTSQDKKSSEKNGRSFLGEWFAKHDWLVYNREKKKAFCSTCTDNSDTQKGAFNSKYGEGFDNWKKGAEKLRDHEESFVHKAACAAMARAKRTLAATFSSLQLERQQLRKKGLISHLQTLKTLLRQGVAIRGKTDSESNIYQFDLDKAINDKADDGSIDQMRRSYYEAIDVIVQSVNERFEQEDLSLVKSIEQILLRSMIDRGIPIDSLTHALIDKDKLRMQLDDLPTILGLYNIEQKKKITSISRISTITDIFNSMPSAKKQCSEVHKIIKLYYTVPLSSASCERTFSAIRRLKTWLRAKTGANHLNDIMFANIQKSDMDRVDIKAIASEFAERNEKRIDYFGK
eukprot:Seg612.2 transcript_id=Seg612.2/GoldUCD/mRNA.D3Y31 product="hypothetical protein" protein_id=Seg612.2/GoldUCD/D3Y31